MEFASLQTSRDGAGGTRPSAGTSTSCSGARCCASGGGGGPGGRATRTPRSRSTAVANPPPKPALRGRPLMSHLRPALGEMPLRHLRTALGATPWMSHLRTALGATPLPKGRMRSRSGPRGGTSAPCMALSCPNPKHRWSLWHPDWHQSRRMRGWAGRTKTLPPSLPHPSKTW